MRNRRRGNTLSESTLTGIPINLLGISIVECSIAMCEYESMMNAVSLAARYAANHGATCESPNTCTITIENIANYIANTAWIISPSSMNVTFTDNSGTTTCTLSACQTNTATFPSSTSNANAVGNNITISVTHKLTNPLPMYWPPHALDDTAYTLGATSVQVIQF